jgi:hypothetical protein
MLAALNVVQTVALAYLAATHRIDRHLQQLSDQTSRGAQQP